MLKLGSARFVYTPTCEEQIHEDLKLSYDFAEHYYHKRVKNDDEDEGDAIEHKEEKMKLLIVIEQGELYSTSNGDGGNVN